MRPLGGRATASDTFQCNVLDVAGITAVIIHVPDIRTNPIPTSIRPQINCGMTPVLVHGNYQTSLLFKGFIITVSMCREKHLNEQGTSRR